MHRTAQQIKWDSQNVMDYAIETAEHKKSLSIASRMLAKGMSVDEIIEFTQLSEEEILGAK